MAQTASAAAAELTGSVLSLLDSALSPLHVAARAAVWHAGLAPGASRFLVALLASVLLALPRMCEGCAREAEGAGLGLSPAP